MAAAPSKTSAVADLAIIVVSHNSRKWLEPCLSSVYERAGAAELDVVVVDNQSSDGSAELVEEKFPQVRVIRSSNRGFAHGNNRGLLTVEAPFVLFLNADAEIATGTLGELLDELRARPEVGLVGCRQLTLDGSLYPTVRRFPSAVRLFFQSIGSEHFPFRTRWLGDRELDMSRYARELDCDWTSGSFMLARREALLAAGFMDERFFLYCEEPDLCLRIKRAGWDVRYLPTLTILHPWGRERYDARLIAQEAFAYRQYMEKHFGAAHRAFGIVALGLGHAIRGVLGGRNAAQRRDRRATSRGALRTLLGLEPPPFGSPPKVAVAPASDAGVLQPGASSPHLAELPL